MQLPNVTHHEFVLEVGLQFVDHIQIACQYNEIVYVYNYN